MSPPLIALEEHFFSEGADSLKPLYAGQLASIPGLSEKLYDLDKVRLHHMDAGHISFQIISHAPGAISASQCTSANDQLFAAVKTHSDRFAGFAVLPVDDPIASAHELTRCMKELNFLGALIDSRSGSTYYDGEAYHPFWEAAESLNAPIYLHPTWPSQQQIDTLYTGNFSHGTTLSLSASGWGWHSDVALHVLRLYASGLFDKYPKLKIIIGHLGEMLPFMLDRIVQLSPRWGARQRSFRQVYDENIWITTSGVWSVDPMATIVRNTKIDHILYSVDYPFAKNEDGWKWWRDLEASGLVDEEGLEKIAHKNSEALFGVKAVKRFD